MNDHSGNMPAPFDRARGALAGLPDVVHTRPATITVDGILGLGSSTYIVETFRQDEVGDTVFLTMVNAAGSQRLVLPPRVTSAIARQREAVVSKRRSKAAKAEAQRRAEAGIVPGFAKTRRPRK